MDVLENVISSLTSDEVRRFKILSNRFKADDEKKMIILFDAIRSGRYLGKENLLLEELYLENNPQTRNRYYRLRNKLIESIEKSLVFYHFKYKDSIHAYYDIQLAILFRDRGNDRLSLFFLKKAEKKAKELDQFIILEQVYEEYTQLALRDVEVDIETILEERKENLEKVKVHRRTTQAIAVITQNLKRSNFSNFRGSILELLEKTKRRIEKSAEIFQSPEGKIQLFRTVSALLLQKEAYPQLVEWTRETISEFEENDLFNNDNHGTRLLMRVWLINSLIKTFKFQEAFIEIDVLDQELRMYGKQNFFAYLFHFYNSKINALKGTGRFEEAGELIDEALEMKEITSQGLNEFYLLRSVADTQFLAGKFEDSCATLARIKQTDGYQHLDPEVQMFLEVFELVNLFEAGKHAEFEGLIKPLRKHFKSTLRSQPHERTERFLDVLERMNTAASEGKQISLVELQKQIEPLYKGVKEFGNNEIILHGLYIRSKSEQRPYSDLLMEELKEISVGGK